MENGLFDFISKYMPLLEEEKQAIIDLAIFRNYKKGTILLKEGDLSKEGYFVVKGCLRSYYIIDGEEKTTVFYAESESLTPLCSINNKPSEYYISCVEDSVITVGNSDMEKSGI